MICNEFRQQNPPLENAKSATVQMQNDYQMSRHRQSTPAASCKEQYTENPKSEKVTTSRFFCKDRFSHSQNSEEISEQNAKVIESRNQGSVELTLFGLTSAVYAVRRHVYRRYLIFVFSLTARSLGHTPALLYINQYECLTVSPSAARHHVLVFPCLARQRARL